MFVIYTGELLERFIFKHVSIRFYSVHTHDDGPRSGWKYKGTY